MKNLHTIQNKIGKLSSCIWLTYYFQKEDLTLKENYLYLPDSDYQVTYLDTRIKYCWHTISLLLSMKPIHWKTIEYGCEGNL